MSFDWSNYLSLAQMLVNQPNEAGMEEAALRSAMSRAYYAAFCAARNFLHDRGEWLPTESRLDHGLVKDRFITSNNRDRQQIGFWLERLYQKRPS
jgi:uncharacterized protein (UPF0332 family)